MWLFARDGFYSIVEKSWDRELQTLTVRTRRRDDLEKLRDQMGDLEFSPQIVETPTADYPFRMRVRKTDLAVVMAREILNINYDNFKNTQPERHSVYLDVWSAIRGLEKSGGALGRFRSKSKKTVPLTDAEWDEWEQTFARTEDDHFKMDDVLDPRD